MPFRRSCTRRLVIPVYDGSPRHLSVIGGDVLQNLYVLLYYSTDRKTKATDAM